MAHFACDGGSSALLCHKPVSLMERIYGQNLGYARVSTDDQNPALQIDALRAAGVPEKHILVEHVSGAAAVRPKFTALTARLGAGDTLMVWKVDRLGRSTLGALETAQRLDAAGVRIVVTTLGADLT